MIGVQLNQVLKKKKEEEAKEDVYKCTREKLLGQLDHVFI